MLIQHTETPECYQNTEQALYKWFDEILNSGRANETEKEKAQRQYSQLFINQFRDGK